VLNADDPASAFFGEVVPGRSLTFGLADQGDVRAANVRYSDQGIVFELRVSGSAREVVLPLLGRFNVQNALAAVGVGLAEGLSLDEVAAGLAQARPAPGRMESIEAGQPFRVLVDYAHTAHAFACVLAEGRAMADALGSRLLVAFGCSGERDRAKRPAMGATAAQLANFFVLTDEDPHSEDPRQIVREIEAGAGGGNYVVEMDRRAALARVFREAQPRDVVLVTGKGHERSMIVAEDRRIPWDERGIVRQELERL